MPSRISVSIGNVRKTHLFFLGGPRIVPNRNDMGSYACLSVVCRAIEEARSRPCGCPACLLRKVAHKRILTMPFAVLPQLATSDIALGSLYATVAAIEAFGLFAAVKVCL